MSRRGHQIWRNVKRLRDIGEDEIADDIDRVRVRNSHFSFFEDELEWVKKQPRTRSSLP
jgi:hypothetical protein